jgi:DNA-binding NarL/FixJ family response regulator
LLGAQEALLAGIGAQDELLRRSEHERTLAAVRAQLGEAAFHAAWAEGRALTIDQAIAEARLVTAAKPTTRSEPAAAPAYPAGLTEREVEVLRLLARGLSNAEIGEQLVVSPRTVGAHLRSIFGKLDVTTRTAAAHVAEELKLI